MTATIRLATDADAPATAEIYSPAVGTPATFEFEAPDAAEMQRRIRETLALHPWLVCDLDGRVAGYAYATRHRSRIGYQWSVETSVYVHGDFQRRGVGRALYRSLLAILAAQGHFNAYAGITLPNPASVALHESVGFRPLTVYRNVGFKLGAWQDVGWWHAELQPYAAAPPSPIPVPALLARPSWRTLLGAGLEHLKPR